MQSAALLSPWKQTSDRLYEKTNSGMHSGFGNGWRHKSRSSCPGATLLSVFPATKALQAYITALLCSQHWAILINSVTCLCPIELFIFLTREHQEGLPQCFLASKPCMDKHIPQSICEMVSDNNLPTKNHIAQHSWAKHNA